MQYYIGLGSNQEDPVSQLRQACEQLAAEPEIELTAVSPFYRSRAVGPPQPDYINAAAELSSDLQPERLLDRLQAIEQRQGRVRREHWGPRTLDLDILICAEQVINSERLTVPHRHLAERNFVLQPLLDIAPQLTLPDGTPVAGLLAKVGLDNLTLLTKATDKALDEGRDH